MTSNLCSSKVFSSYLHLDTHVLALNVTIWGKSKWMNVPSLQGSEHSLFLSCGKSKLFIVNLKSETSLFIMSLYAEILHIDYSTVTK